MQFACRSPPIWSSRRAENFDGVGLERLDVMLTVVNVDRSLAPSTGRLRRHALPDVNRAEGVVRLASCFRRPAGARR